MVPRSTRALYDGGFNPETGAYHVYVDYPHEQPTLVLVTAVAAVKGVEATQLDPLDSYFNTESLNTLFKRDAAGTPRAPACLRLEYEECEITFYSSGEIVIEPPEQDSE